jgi:hypothetical protein
MASTANEPVTLTLLFGIVAGTLLHPLKMKPSL